MGGTTGTPTTTPPAAGASTAATGLPSWATPANLNAAVAANPVAAKDLATRAGFTPGPNLGFPTGQAVEVAPKGGPVGFQSAPYPTPHIGALPHIGAPDKPAPVAPAAAAPAAPVKPPPPTPQNDLVYAGQPDMTPMAGRSTAGAMNLFGFNTGLTGTSAYRLPQLEPGTSLTPAQATQYNSIPRDQYDAFMKLYGVGYDQPAYDNFLSNDWLRIQTGGGQ